MTKATPILVEPTLKSTSGAAINVLAPTPSTRKVSSVPFSGRMAKSIPEVKMEELSLLTPNLSTKLAVTISMEL